MGAHLHRDEDGPLRDPVRTHEPYVVVEGGLVQYTVPAGGPEIHVFDLDWGSMAITKQDLEDAEQMLADAKRMHAPDDDYIVGEIEDRIEECKDALKEEADGEHA